MSRQSPAWVAWVGGFRVLTALSTGSPTVMRTLLICSASSRRSFSHNAAAIQPPSHHEHSTGEFEYASYKQGLPQRERLGANGWRKGVGHILRDREQCLHAVGCCTVRVRLRTNGQIGEDGGQCSKAV